MGGLAGAVAACGGMGPISTADVGFQEPDFDRDPLTVPKEDLREIQVMAACKGGDWVCTKYAR